MKNILVVIDMQRDFITGALGSSDAVSIVPNVIEKIKSYPTENVFATRDTHEANYLETIEGKHLPVPHCVIGTDGWELAPEIAECLDGATIIDKPTFGSTALAEVLKLLNEEEPISVELVGLCTDICVVSNALLLKAYMPDIEIAVDAACCAGTSLEKHKAALETMQSCHINII